MEKKTGKKEKDNMYEAIIRKKAGWFIWPIGIIQVLSMTTTFIVSPLLWIWVSWSVAWRVFLTGLILSFIFTWIYKVIKATINDIVKRLNTEKK